MSLKRKNSPKITIEDDKYIHYGYEMYDKNDNSLGGAFATLIEDRNTGYVYHSVKCKETCLGKKKGGFLVYKELIKRLQSYKMRFLNDYEYIQISDDQVKELHQALTEYLANKE